MKRIVSLLVSILFLLNSSLAYTVTIKIKNINLTITRDAGETVNLRSKLEKIKGWEVKSGGVTIENNQFIMPENDVEVEAVIESLTAKYMLTVENFGARSRSLKLANSEVVATVTESSKRIFTKWTAEGIVLTPEQEISKTISFSMPENDVTLIANYQENNIENQTYTISYEKNAGEDIVENMPAPHTKTHGEATTLSSDIPTRPGYNFLGWALESNATEAMFTNGETYTLEGDKTLYAVWSSASSNIDIDGLLDGVGSENIEGFGTFDVYINGSLVAEGVTEYNEAVSYGSTYEINNIQVAEGHTYNGVSSGSVTGTIGTSNIVTVLSFTTNTPSTYTVTYNSELFATTGKTEAGVTIAYDSTTKYLTLNGTTTADFIIASAEDISFIEGEQYKITLEYISGGYTSADQVLFATYIKNESNANASTPNWTDTILPTSGSETTTLTVNSAAATEGSKLYFWMYSPTSGDTYNNYVVKVNVTKVENKTVTYGSTYGELPTPTRTGYTFNGWYNTENGGTQITSSSGVTTAENHTLYAQWTPNTYTVTFDNGNLIYNLNDVSSTVAEGMTYSVNNGVVTVTARQNDGYGTTNGRVYLEAGKEYVFSCDISGQWVVNEGNGKQESYLLLDGGYTEFYHMGTNTNYIFTPEVTGTYYLRLDVNTVGTTEIFSNIRIIEKTNAKTVTYGSTYGELPTPTRTGYTFNGWYNTENGGTQITSSSGVTATGNHTLYAQWTANNYYLDLNGVLDGTYSGGIAGYGTADVYVNGVLVASGVNDYYALHPYGSTYSITNIQAVSGHTYNGVSSGSLSGTIGADTVNVNLSFSTDTIGQLPAFTYTGNCELIDDGKSGSVQNWRIKFLTSGTLTFTRVVNSIDVFCVGGGGAGCDAGGGGGYTTTSKGISVSTGSNYTITIGAGGAVCSSYPNSESVSAYSAGNGGATSAFNVTANGGGTAYKTLDSNGRKVRYGGSGGSGGGAWSNGTVAGNGGSDGGNGGDPYDMSWSYAGSGQGTTTREFGESWGTLYAGGGGGGDYGEGTRGVGGSGGGGNGYVATNGTEYHGSAGTANTGGGGGGGWGVGHGYAGGSGIVIIRNAR